MKFLTLFMALGLLSFTEAFAHNESEKVPFPEFKDAEISEMSFNQLQKLRYAYIEFLMKSEEDEVKGLIPDPKIQTTSFKSFWSDLLIAHAYAIAPDGSVCFFGGWPSLMSGGKCARPWREANNEKIKALGSYGKSSVCGSETKFRCNPALFGSPDQGGPGLCIETGGSYDHLTEKCERASRAFVPKVIESYQVDPSAFTALSGEIKKFCDSFENYDSCDDLARRVKEITGKDIGTYSGKGTDPNKPSAQGAGGRGRNVAPLEGEELGFAGSPRASTGAQVLDRCEDLLKGKSDVQNRNILGSLQREECLDPGIRESLGSLKDFEDLSQKVNYSAAVTNVNAKAFEQTIMALIANEIRYGENKLPLEDKNALFNTLVKNFPDIKNDSRYKEAFEKAYGQLNKEVKAGRLYPFDPESTRTQFNQLSGYVNEACSKIRDNYVKKFGDPGLLSRTWNHSQYQDFYKLEARKVTGELDVLLKESVVGHLLSTSYFKKNVFDPSDAFAEECARNPGYQVIKQPLSLSNLKSGHNEVAGMMRKNLAAINDRERDLNSGDKDRAAKVLADYLKTDASIVNLSMDGLDKDAQFQLGVSICHETNKILTSDKRWLMADMAIGGIGAAAGIVLIATGIGSPLGVALTAASLGVAGYEGGRAVQNYTAASARGRAADLALAERRRQMEGYLAESDAVRSGKKDALLQGGLAVLTGFAPVKVLASASRGARAGQTGLILARDAQTTRSALAVVSNESKAVAVVASIESRAVATSQTVRASTPQVERAEARNITSAGRIIPAGARAAQETVAESTDFMKKSFNSLSEQQRHLVRVEARKIIDEAGAGLPSKVLRGRSVNRMSIAECEEAMRQMKPGAKDAKDAYRRLTKVFHSDGKPQALGEFLSEEMKILNEMKARIQQLGGRL